MNTKPTLAAVILTALAIATPMAVPSTTYAKSCGRVSFEAQTDWGANNIKASGVACKKARSVARGSKSISADGDGKYRYNKRGFKCVGTRKEPDYGLPYTSYRCKRGTAKVTFKYT